MSEKPTAGRNRPRFAAVAAILLLLGGVILGVVVGLGEDEEAAEATTGPKNSTTSTGPLPDCTVRGIPGADLAGCDLGSQDLAGADLRRADLSEADLSEADLSRADLTETRFVGADLSGATLSDAEMSSTILLEADMTNATVRNVVWIFDQLLYAADLTGADFTGSTLVGVWNDVTCPNGVNSRSIEPETCDGQGGGL